MPDCVRSLRQNSPIPVRNKVATRPWQHVLEPLSGYLQLAATLATDTGLPLPPQTYQGGFNFGPALPSNRTVAELVLEILKHWPGTWEDRSDPAAPHEAVKLNLATDKAFHLLQWEPRWDFEQTVRQTIEWYRSSAGCRSAADFRALTSNQIHAYCAR